MFNRILAVAPHADDIEFGCSGSLSRFIREGSEVYYLVFSICEEWVPKGFRENILKEEATESAKILGIKENNVNIYHFRATELWKKREEIFNILEKINNDFIPDCVFCHAGTDLHQDHHTIFKEVSRVFKRSTVLGYEMPWNNIKFVSNFHVSLQRQDVEKKIEALKKFKSQFHRKYLDEELIYSIARMRGIQIREMFAEAFEVIRAVIK